MTCGRRSSRTTIVRLIVEPPRSVVPGIGCGSESPSTYRSQIAPPTVLAAPSLSGKPTLREQAAEQVPPSRSKSPPCCVASSAAGASVVARSVAASMLVSARLVAVPGRPELPLGALRAEQVRGEAAVFVVRVNSQQCPPALHFGVGDLTALLASQLGAHGCPAPFSAETKGAERRSSGSRELEIPGSDLAQTSMRGGHPGRRPSSA